MSKDPTNNLNDSLEGKIDRLIIAIHSIGSRMESMESRIESIESRLGKVETRLSTLETKVDERFKDTGPMWEAVQGQLTEVESTLRGEIQGLRGEMEKGFRLVDRRMEYYIGELGKMHGYQRDLEDRVDKIEKRVNQ